MDKAQEDNFIIYLYSNSTVNMFCPWKSAATKQPQMIKLRYNWFWTHDYFLGILIAQKDQANSSENIFKLIHLQVHMTNLNFEPNFEKNSKKILLSADHLLLIVLSRKGHKGGFNNPTPQPQHQMKGRLYITFNIKIATLIHNITKKKNPKIFKPND